MPNIPIDFGIITIEDHIDAFTVPQLSVSQIPLNLTLGGGALLNANINGGVGVITVPVFHLSPVPGLGNIGGLSSGFFNTGGELPVSATSVLPSPAWATWVRWPRATTTTAIC